MSTASAKARHRQDQGRPARPSGGHRGAKAVAAKLPFKLAARQGADRHAEAVGQAPVLGRQAGRTGHLRQGPGRSGGDRAPLRPRRARPRVEPELRRPARVQPADGVDPRLPPGPSSIPRSARCCTSPAAASATRCSARCRRQPAAAGARCVTSSPRPIRRPATDRGPRAGQALRRADRGRRGRHHRQQPATCTAISAPTAPARRPRCG